MRPRMIATDLDGTLLDAHRALSPRTIEAVRGAVAQGIGFVLVTARPPRTVTPIADRLGVALEALCGNGTLLARFPGSTTTLIESFDAAQASSIVARLRPALPEAGFALETGFKVYHEAAFGPGQVGDEHRILTDSLDAAAGTARSIIKVLARSPLRSADEMVAVARATIGSDGESSHSGGRGLLEIAPPGASKAAALAWLCSRRGIDAAEVTAFGDMPNDLPMLRWAGIGFAVANAHPEVLAAADAVVGHHAQDGVAAAIEALLG